MINSDIAKKFEAYYRSFPAADMHDLKWHHTCRVVHNAEQIIAHEQELAPYADNGRIAAWLHDLGRFSQFEKYHTFSDRVSVNHALLSCGEALRLGWLDELPANERNRILRAIELHNMKVLPEGLPTDEFLLSHLVRDADKLDIFTVLDEAIRTNYLPTHPEVYWGLPFSAKPSEDVIQSILNDKPIDYASIKCFADFIFIQVGWLKSGLHFRESYRLADEREELQIRSNYLQQIIPEHADLIQDLCAHVQNSLKKHI